MLKRNRWPLISLLAMLVMAVLIIIGSLTVGALQGEAAQDHIEYVSLSGPYGAYTRVTVTGLTPYVFAPTGAGSADQNDFDTVTGMMETYGEKLDIAAAINAGIFYNTAGQTQYCFHNKEADGVLIAGGVVLKSTESIDHTECDVLVIDEDGNVGWTDYWADADALAAGEGSYYDIYGQTVTGKAIVSAVTGFVPVVVGGQSVYDPADEPLYGFDNYIAHYAQSAVRQIFGVREDGSCVILTSSTGWTLEDAAVTAIAEECVFAYNLDGGGSAETVIMTESEDRQEINTLHGQSRGSRSLPTYIVFTDTNEAPVSAVPTAITAAPVQGVLPVGSSLADIAGAIEVTEYFTNADGNTSQRSLHSGQGLDPSGEIGHVVIGGSSEELSVMKTSVTPEGTLFYTKSDEETAQSLAVSGSSREDGAYYDYSAGYTLSTADSLTTPGVKTVTVTYTPGGGYEPLTAQVRITLS